MSFKVAQFTLSSSLATSGTVAVSYPSGTSASDYTVLGHILVAKGFGSFTKEAGGISLAFGASSITLTYSGTTTLPAGTECYLQLNRPGADGNTDSTGVDTRITYRALDSFLVEIDLGAPLTADADGICASQAITSAAGGTINGALASGGAVTLDVPRNVVAAWTTTAVMTITGTDEYGNVLVESSASGTSLAGKKAFKTITAVDVSTNVTGATVGTGDVLGLPIFLPGTGYVLRELQDGAAPTAGTIVAGVTTTATATTGDVRGTYDPNAAADGSKQFKLIAALGEPNEKGVDQYAG